MQLNGASQQQPQQGTAAGNKKSGFYTFYFQADKIMLFYMKNPHALAVIFVKGGISGRYFCAPVIFCTYLGLDKAGKYQRLYHICRVYAWFNHNPAYLFNILTGVNC